jgi:hypothetical protein
LQGGDKPYLISGADDKLIKVWDYQNKSCVQTLEGHTHNVTAVCFHPELPLIISGSEDGVCVCVCVYVCVCVCVCCILSECSSVVPWVGLVCVTEDVALVIPRPAQPLHRHGAAVALDDLPPGAPAELRL